MPDLSHAMAFKVDNLYIFAMCKTIWNLFFLSNDLSKVEMKNGQLFNKTLGFSSFSVDNCTNEPASVDDFITEAMHCVIVSMR